MNLRHIEGFKAEIENGAVQRAAELASPDKTVLLSPACASFDMFKSYADRGQTFRVIMDTLEDRGYNLAWRVVDARHFVPQHRERTFIVGLHRDVYGERSFVFPELPARDRQPVLGDILQSQVEDKYTLTPHLWQYLQDYAAKHRAAGNGFGYGLVRRDSVTRTLSARYHKDGSEILIDDGGGRPRHGDAARAVAGDQAARRIPDVFRARRFHHQERA